jgi:hypothetical protein
MRVHAAMDFTGRITPSYEMLAEIAESISMFGK